MIKLVKIWNEKNKEGVLINVGSKEYYMDPRTPFEGLEACKQLDEKRKEIDCTRIIYPTKFVTVKGTPMEVMEKMRDVNIASTLLVDIYAAGFTIKKFMEQNESINGLKI